jgi:antitoxin ChpS
MYTTNLKKVDGSVVLALPPEVLDLVDFEVDMRVDITVQDGKLVIASQQSRRYRLQDLIAQCDPTAPPPPVDREWLDAPAAGGELL